MSLCKQCDARVVWKQGTVPGKPKQWQCFNADSSTVHWDQCSQLRTAAIKRTGTPFYEEGMHEKVWGYKTPLKKSGELLMRSEPHKAVKGTRFKHSGKCRECVPPWEVCNKCPDRIAA